MMERRRGFSLVEVMITLALFALLMTLVSSALISFMRFYRQGTEMAGLRQKASSIMNILTADIIRANAIYCPLYPGAPSSDMLMIWVPDIYANEDSTSSSGDLHVYYFFYPPPEGYVRRWTKYDDIHIFEGIKYINFSTDDAKTWKITIDLTVAKDVNDPASPSYSLSTSACRRGTMELWEFGP
jgi:prepilin-type N-terminal cleavage/methylation domain-containing protein